MDGGIGPSTLANDYTYVRANEQFMRLVVS